MQTIDGKNQIPKFDFKDTNFSLFAFKGLNFRLFFKGWNFRVPSRLKVSPILIT